MGINYLAVVAAALSTFLIGALWYSPLLFNNAWMKASGLTKEDVAGANMAKIFGLAFVFELIMAANLAAFLAGPNTTMMRGAMTGAHVGVGWAALAIAILALFERRSWTYTLINGGYFAVSFIVMGAILGAWR